MSRKVEIRIDGTYAAGPALKQAEGALGRIDASARGAAGGFRSLASPAAGFAVGRLAVEAAFAVRRFGASVIAAGDEVTNASTSIGIDAQQWQRFAYAATVSGSNANELRMAFGRLQAVLGRELGGEQARAFQRLNLSVRELQTLAPDAAFRKIATAISAVPNATERAATAIALFGETGARLLPMITNMERLTDSADRFGTVMSARTLANMARFDAGIKTMRMVAQNAIGAAMPGTGWEAGGAALGGVGGGIIGGLLGGTMGASVGVTIGTLVVGGVGQELQGAIVRAMTGGREVGDVSREEAERERLRAAGLRGGQAGYERERARIVEDYRREHEQTYSSVPQMQADAQRESEKLEAAREKIAVAEQIAGLARQLERAREEARWQAAYEQALDRLAERAVARARQREQRVADGRVAAADAALQRIADAREKNADAQQRADERLERLREARTPEGRAAARERERDEARARRLGQRSARQLTAEERAFVRVGQNLPEGFAFERGERRTLARLLSKRERGGRLTGAEREWLAEIEARRDAARARERGQALEREQRGAAGQQRDAAAGARQVAEKNAAADLAAADAKLRDEAERVKRRDRPPADAKLRDEAERVKRRDRPPAEAAAKAIEEQILAINDRIAESATAVARAELEAQRARLSEILGTLTVPEFRVPEHLPEYVPPEPSPLGPGQAPSPAPAWPGGLPFFEPPGSRMLMAPYLAGAGAEASLNAKVAGVLRTIAGNTEQTVRGLREVKEVLGLA